MGSAKVWKVAPVILRHAVSRIYINILRYNLAQKNCPYRPESSIHQSVRFDGKQDSLIGLRVFFLGGGGGGGDPNLNVPSRGGGAPCRRQIPTCWEGEGEILRF